MSGCIRQTTKKYLSRDSPPYPANQCPNEIKKGNDGLNYQSKPDKNGVYKWSILDPNLPSEKPKKNETVRIDENLIYVAIKDKDGKYYWHKIVLKKKKNPDDYFRQFPNYKKPIYDYKKFLKVIPELKKELKKINVALIYVKYSEPFFDDYDTEVGFEILDTKYPPNQQYMMLTETNIYINTRSKDGCVSSIFSISFENQEKFKEILNKFFPKRIIGLDKLPKKPRKLENHMNVIKICYEEVTKLKKKN